MTTPSTTGTPASLLGTPPADAKTAPAGTPPPAETKPAGTPPAAETKPAETKPTEPAKPAELEVKFAEGLGVTEETAKAFKGLAGELGLDSAKAQKLADLYASTAQAGQKAAEEAWAAQQAKWTESVKADPEVGGAKLQASTEAAGRFITKYGGADAAELRQWLTASGAGNHPLLVRLMARAGAAMKEDSIAGSSVPAGANGKVRTPDEEARSLYTHPRSQALMFTPKQ